MHERKANVKLHYRRQKIFWSLSSGSVKTYNHTCMTSHLHQPTAARCSTCRHRPIYHLSYIQKQVLPFSLYSITTTAPWTRWKLMEGFQALKLQLIKLHTNLKVGAYHSVSAKQTHYNKSWLKVS